MQGLRRRFHLRQAWPKRPQLPRRVRPCRVEYVLGDAVRDTHTMWVYLETWLVQDGTLPWLQRGQRLREVGLVAACWSVGPAPAQMASSMKRDLIPMVSPRNIAG